MTNPANTARRRPTHSTARRDDQPIRHRDETTSPADTPRWASQPDEPRDWSSIWDTVTSRHVSICITSTPFQIFYFAYPLCENLSAKYSSPKFQCPLPMMETQTTQWTEQHVRQSLPGKYPFLLLPLHSNFLLWYSIVCVNLSAKHSSLKFQCSLGKTETQLVHTPRWPAQPTLRDEQPSRTSQESGAASWTVISPARIHIFFFHSYFPFSFFSNPLPSLHFPLAYPYRSCVVKIHPIY
jgi:hypothetical protein